MTNFTVCALSGLFITCVGAVSPAEAAATIDHQQIPAGDRTEDLSIPEFGKLQWGMTQNQVRTLYPKVEESHESGPGKPPPYNTLVMRGYVIDGCKFKVTLMFTNTPKDALTNVIFAFDGEDFENCRDKMLQRIFRRFGTSPSQGKGSIRQWSGPVTTAWFIESGAGNRHSFNFSFNRTGALGTYLD